MYRIINVCQKYIDKRCLVLLKAKKKKTRNLNSDNQQEKKKSHFKALL